jgi:hypothetical protein
LSRGSSRIGLIILIDLIACFALSYIGLWYFVFVPSAVLGFFVIGRWRNLAYFGAAGAVGTLIPIFISQASARLASAAVVGAVIGLPGGYLVLLLMTALISFLVSGFGAVLTSSLLD